MRSSCLSRLASASALALAAAAAAAAAGDWYALVLAAFAAGLLAATGRPPPALLAAAAAAAGLALPVLSLEISCVFLLLPPLKYLGGGGSGNANGSSSSSCLGFAAETDFFLRKGRKAALQEAAETMHEP
jgi:hypothetical protein